MVICRFLDGFGKLLGDLLMYLVGRVICDVANFVGVIAEVIFDPLEG